MGGAQRRGGGGFVTRDDNEREGGIGDLGSSMLYRWSLTAGSRSVSASGPLVPWFCDGERLN